MSEARFQTGCRPSRASGSSLLLTLGSLLVGACLPPSAVAPTPASAAETEPERAPAGDRCRVLLGELDREGLPQTRELRWDARGVTEDRRAGLIAGDAEQLVEVVFERRPYATTELYGEAAIVCEEPVITLRKLPDGLAQPLIAGRPACVGQVDGEAIALESSLELDSVLGPFLSWRTRVDGNGPEPIHQLSHRTIDVRTGEPLDPELWLLEPTPTMARAPETVGLSCERADIPATIAALDGFAIRWSDSAGPQLVYGYRCCGGRSCEYAEPIPSVDAELLDRLPDPDGLLHSPFGCGSIGLDGQLRTRDGAAVGRVTLSRDRLVGLVFLPPG